MSAEKQTPYDYSNNPDVRNFAKSIHQENPNFLHPIISKRQKEAREIIEKLPEANGLTEEFPELIPHPVDQGLILTSFDKFDGMHVEIPPEEHLEGWRRTREFNLRLANHPSRIAAIRELENEGFKPPEKTHGILDEQADHGVILQLSDLGQNIDLKRNYNNNKTGVDVEEEIAKTQTHRTELLATGPFSFVGKRVRSFVGLGAMPDINGSILALETAAKMHMLAEVPEVGVFANPMRQAELAKAVFEKLNPNDPQLLGRSKKDIDYILNSWRSSIVGVLEVDEVKALRRAELLASVGINTFRVYGHTQGGDVINTTMRLRKEYPNAEIFASQITNVNTARACEDAGADAIIIGVGSGGRCTTADLSQLIPSNALLA